MRPRRRDSTIRRAARNSSAIRDEATPPPRPARMSSIPYPWEGGDSRFADAVAYTLTASLAVLDTASALREKWLYDIYRMGRDSVERGEAASPSAYVIPHDQWDPGEADELVNILLVGGVESNGRRLRSRSQASRSRPGPTSSRATRLSFHTSSISWSHRIIPTGDARPMDLPILHTT